MNPRRFKTVVFVCAIAVVSLAVTVLGRQIKVDVDLVSVVSTVQDASGKYVTGLEATDFHVYEDGVEQKVAVFEKQDVDSAVGILVDSSLSMVDLSLIHISEPTRLLSISY